MNFTWHGQTCFKIISQKNKDGAVSILIDPFPKETGLRSPKAEADIILFTDSGRTVPGNGFIVSGPGEYEVKGVCIKGIQCFANKNKNCEKTLYFIEAEDMKICHLGLFSESELNSKYAEEIGGADILMLPVGGGDSLDAKSALKIMSQLEPKITIPMHYKVPGLKIKLDGLENFLKALGIKKLELLEKLSVKKRDLPEDEAKIIALKP